MDLFTLASGDYYLIIIESTVIVGLLAALVLALIIWSQYKDLASKGWLEICIGIASIMIHGVFDVLDTFIWSIDGFRDLLNVFDGIFFVAGIILITIGIWMIADHGAKAWGI
ncbi:MAG: hypothetical protein ACTSRU_08465 [Candidatus Hodarchaeales archaeon]